GNARLPQCTEGAGDSPKAFEQTSPKRSSTLSVSMHFLAGFFLFSPTEMDKCTYLETSCRRCAIRKLFPQEDTSENECLASGWHDPVQVAGPPCAAKWLRASVHVLWF